MTLTIKLPKDYDFATADECALLLADAVASLECRHKARIKQGTILGPETEHKLYLYRAISAALSAILSAMDDSEHITPARQQAKDAQLAVESLPAGVAKPSATSPTATLRCNGCGKVAPAADYSDGRQCPITALQADFYSCPACFGFLIFPAEATP